MPKTLSIAIWQGRCPHCRKGYIFKYPFSDISRFAVMNQQCDHCGVNFTPEPGFYFGAMYISYAFTIALFVGIWLVLSIVFSPPEWVYMVSIIASCFLIIPWSFRYSRILFLYWFGGLQPK